MTHTPKEKDKIKWTERRIAYALQSFTFKRKYLCLVPNCNWTGYEADMLVVTENLRLIDVEIKISRSDLKADARKDKWKHHFDRILDSRHGCAHENGWRSPDRVREWPEKVWKHYYAMPREIWDDSLMDCLPSDKSGVLLVMHRDGQYHVSVKRMATPDRQAKPLNERAAMDIARLGNIRMWEAIRKADL